MEDFKSKSILICHEFYGQYNAWSGPQKAKNRPKIENTDFENLLFNHII